MGFRRGEKRESQVKETNAKLKGKERREGQRALRIEERERGRNE